MRPDPKCRLRAFLKFQHTDFTVLDRCDILYVGHKSDAGVGSGRRRQIFRLIWISLLHYVVVKRVRNRTARFCYAFGSTDCYGI
jgi:hypothetical protein